ncbi:hypothetical protein CROQUDRAFT_659432 [Cronartium quercuum f. sp. fusiforme G11]|uniref:Uncharacterized protein n=1 Tax=Cronartium quercuum f. sp. fusiforme G11 TaxID=708437 RepID=A0A9P6TBQ8_9BASI|nr:hypothetical protein CROQUDRAFT_659432 [Cronartium quercuum f. sp. fusiforme G11]
MGSSSPSPGQIRSINTLSSSDLGIRIRTAGRVIESNKCEWRVVIASDEASIEVNCQIPMSAARLTDGLPRVGEQWMVLGDLVPVEDRVWNGKPALVRNVSIFAVLIKYVPDLNLREWDREAQEEMPTTIVRN